MSARGVVVSIASAVSFGAAYFITPMLQPASAESLWAIRCLVVIPLVAIVLLSARQWSLVREIGQRIAKKPAMLFVFLASSLLLTLQIWIFSWAPLHGRGMQVALGYFLLPLVLVVVGRVLYKDQLDRWQWTAVGLAAVGVIFELIRVGGVSWETLVVAGCYPFYFVLRRKIGTGHLGGMFWDFSLMAPIALGVVIHEIWFTDATGANPALWWSAPVYALITGFALVFYLTASKLLSLSLFGLLSYLEPALLMVASLLNGETLEPGEYVMYAAIWLAVLVILIGGIVEMVRGRRGGTRAAG